jgi:hypothetical protein
MAMLSGIPLASQKEEIACGSTSGERNWPRSSRPPEI